MAGCRTTPRSCQIPKATPDVSNPAPPVGDTCARDQGSPVRVSRWLICRRTPRDSNRSGKALSRSCGDMGGGCNAALDWSPGPIIPRVFYAPSTALNRGLGDDNLFECLSVTLLVLLVLLEVCLEVCLVSSQLRSPSRVQVQVSTPHDSTDVQQQKKKKRAGART